ncbi:cross-pathway control 1 [Whalleya microplaca]|nr:cross-pathway control 1 [Whalleya microplaca]
MAPTQQFAACEKKLLKSHLAHPVLRPRSSLLPLLLPTQPTITDTTEHTTSEQHGIPQQDALSNSTSCLTSFPVLSAATATIQSPSINGFLPTPSPASALPPQADLNFNAAIHGSSNSSSYPSATIPPQDFPVFTTDSHQSPWPPSSAQSLPAQSAQPPSFPHHSPQQDFVLFDQAPPRRTNVNRTASSPASAAALGSLNNANRRHSAQLTSGSASPSLQNHQVARIIQATGHQTSSTAFTNRYHPPAQNHQDQQQFYASLSAPSSTTAANQQNRPARPPVPLFIQGVGNQQPAGKMDLQGKSPVSVARNFPSSHKTDAMGNLEDFTAFGGGASTTAYSSPAVPGYDLNVSSASSTSNMSTVSPQDLLIREPFTSAPNSTQFTNLTSPSIYNESPEFNDSSYEVSPNFGSNDFDKGAQDVWFPLFPQGENITGQASAADNSPAEQFEELEVVEETVQPQPQQPRRNAGSSSSPPARSHGRHSSVAGVNARRAKPLPPIVVEDKTNPTAMKRARNTLAARKSRQRKAQRLEDLEETIVELRKEIDYWKNLALSKPGINAS